MSESGHRVNLLVRAIPKKDLFTRTIDFKNFLFTYGSRNWTSMHHAFVQTSQNSVDLCTMFVFLLLTFILNFYTECSGLKEIPMRGRGGSAWENHLLTTGIGSQDSAKGFWQANLDNFDSSCNLTFTQKYYVGENFDPAKCILI